MYTPLRISRTIARRTPVPARFLPCLLACACFNATVGEASDNSVPADCPDLAATGRPLPGPRFDALLAGLPPGELRERLETGADRPFAASELAIGHRGAALRYPEHTRESYLAAARTGAGVIECDVTFTRDRQLVCRHSQCDLASTTDILRTPLAARCSEPFRPAVFSAEGELVSAATAKCCTYDLTLEEFLSLRGRLDAVDPTARTVEDYLDATPDIALDPCLEEGTLLSHRDSIELIDGLGAQMIPELKAPEAAMPFEGWSRADYARQLVRDYQEAGIAPERLWLQSFHPEDIELWLREFPAYGRRALWLDGRYTQAGFDHRDPTQLAPVFEDLVRRGLRWLGPPLWMLVEDRDGAIVPSDYARAARDAGLGIMTWTLERSGPLTGGGGWYYQTLNGQNRGPRAGSGLISRDSDTLRLLDVLVRDVGVHGVFSDWPATVADYARRTDWQPPPEP
jgi:glycerophosphoryl diester phosphodiesterase